MILAGKMTAVQPLGKGRPGFTPVTPRESGVSFSNSIDERLLPGNQNLLLGSGVAAGDFDGDGWCDLFLCALTRGNALYRNRGGWRFEDATERAGVALAGSTNTGAAFADIDGDGDLDLLVSSLGQGVRLFRNETNGTFRDATAEAGLASRTGSLSMTLADVDGDGDLDLFVCNYGALAISKSEMQFNVRLVNGQPELTGPHAGRLRIVEGKLVELGEPSVLYLNQGGGIFRAATWNSPRFLDEDGRPMEAPWDFSLSAQLRDVNGDGAPDLFVCNDFDTPDRFWLNDGRGNFRLAPRPALRCQSHASMGVDFADMDRDGHLDFLVVEMLATERARRLWQLNPLATVTIPPPFWSFRPEVARNTLFRGRGDGTFEEMANYAGLAASDWSWQGAFLDVDLDGYEDVLVATGHWFDTQDLDVPPVASSSPREHHARLLRTPHLFTPNRAWRNRGDLTFEDRSNAWNFNDTNVNHGMAFADLDNDGDLDVAVNCLNASALLLRNDADAPRLAVRLRGTAPNTRGIGARVTLRGGPVAAQTQEIISGGKYLSSDDAMRVFAAGTNRMELEVVWRSGARTVLANVQPNSIYEIAEAGSTRAPEPGPATTSAPRFVDESHRLHHRHVDPPFDDFALQPLLSRKLSQRGPGLCVTDLDGDGHDDLVAGTGRGGRISFHQGDGRGGFTLGATSEPVPDDVLALVDWTGAPGKPGILCTMARHESAGQHPPLLRLALEGNELVFNSVANAASLPMVRSTGHCLSVADYDGDGDLDVFLGSHAVPGRYPEAAPSVLLRNESGALRGDRANSDVLRDVGLVNSALWSDLNADGWPELILACEWGPLRIFRNDRGRLAPWDPRLTLEARNSKLETLDTLTGWWTGLAAADFNHDGRMDLVAGNWGLNGPERASVAQPLRLYFTDCLERGVLDLFEAEYDYPGVEPMPARPLTELASAVPLLRAGHRTHREWAATPIRAALASFKNVRDAQAVTLAHTVFLNHGDHFEARPLPAEAQRAPVWSIVASDVDGDGVDDLFLAQNFSATRPGMARLTSGRGLLLRGDGTGAFQSVGGTAGGVAIDGDQRGAAAGDFDEDGCPDLVVSQNGESTRLLRNKARAPGVRVRVSGGPANPTGVGAVVRLVSDGQVRATREIHGGSGWLSQDSSVVLLPARRSDAKAELQVRWPGGRETRTALPPAARQVVVQSTGALEMR